jgi:DNA-binding response OmpR family regulator
MSRDRSSLQVKPRRTVLVVEDDFFLRSAVVDVLSRHGFAVFEAADTDRAWDFLRSEAIDLLFTDIRLPGFMDGLALATLVRKKCPEMKIIVASGLALSGIDPKTADECLGKPYQFDHMVAVINRLLGGGAPPARRGRPPVSDKAARGRNSITVS